MSCPGSPSLSAGLVNSGEVEDWFDPSIFDRMVVRESLYKNMDEIVDDLIGLSESIREKNQKAGEYRETAIERLTEFFFRLSQSATDPAFLTIYRKEAEGITLEVRNIDPAVPLQEICTAHACCILISGTLSPVEQFRPVLLWGYPGKNTNPAQCIPKREPSDLLCKRYYDCILHAAEQGEQCPDRELHPGILCTQREPC